MEAITEKEYFDKLDRVGKQYDEILNQNVVNITCGCGIQYSIEMMYQCLYCNEWYCKSCAEDHFGKSVEQWRKEHPNPF